MTLLKPATVEALDEQAPVQTIDGEDGEQLYRLTAQCRSCQVELHLDSEEVPNELARAMAAGLLSRVFGGLICTACADQLEAAEERSQSEERFRERLASSALPAALHGFEFGEMLPEEGRREVVDAVRTWAVTEDAKGLCLFGGVGVGKTRLAATAAWQRLRRYSVRWVSMPILLATLGAAFNDKERKQAISVLTGKGALILDDLDKINPSDWAKNQLFAALDKRIQAGSPLLVTTNLRPSELGEKFGDPIMSRVAGLDVLELPGNDNRLRFEFDGKPKP